MNGPPWIFYEFYQRLRDELGMPLVYDQYLLFLEAFLKHSLPKSKDQDQIKRELYHLMRLLWLSRREYEKDFKRCFDEAFEAWTNLWQLADPVIETTKNVSAQPLEPEFTKPKEIKPQPKQKEEEKEKEVTETISYQNIYLQFSETSGLDYEGEKPTFRDTRMNHAFIFTDKFLPIPPRRAQRIWKKIKVYPTRKITAWIDLKKTIDQLARQKVLDRPLYQVFWENRRKVIFFIDHSQPMSTFEAWRRLIIKAFRQSNENCQVETYYYRRLPRQRVFEDGTSSFVFYKDMAHIEAVYLGKEIKKWSSKSTAIFIFSDAGLGSTELDSQELQRALEWLELLQHHFKHRAWMNPHPESRWNSKLAIYGSLFIPMVETTEEGLQKAVSVL